MRCAVLCMLDCFPFVIQWATTLGLFWCRIQLHYIATKQNPGLDFFLHPSSFEYEQKTLTLASCHKYITTIWYPVPGPESRGPVGGAPMQRLWTRNTQNPAHLNWFPVFYRHKKINNNKNNNNNNNKTPCFLSPVTANSVGELGFWPREQAGHSKLA
jgi:hypothetical protein